MSSIDFHQFASDVKTEWGKIIDAEKIGDRSGPPDLVRLNRSVDKVYILDKLRLYCRYTFSIKQYPDSNLAGKASDFAGMHFLMERHRAVVLETPVLYLYLKTVDLCKHEDPTEDLVPQFESLLKYIEEHSEVVSKLDKLTILSVLVSYAILGFNKKIIAYKRPVFLLNVAMINYQYGASWNKYPMAPFIFKNMVMMVAGIKDLNLLKEANLFGVTDLGPTEDNIDWAEKFIGTYTSRIAKHPKRKLYINYCKAYCAYKRTEFRRSLAMLLKTQETEGEIMNLDTKMLKAICLFELELIGEKKDLRWLRNNELRMDTLMESYRKQIEYLVKEQGRHKDFSDVHTALYRLLKELYSFFRESRGQQFRANKATIEFNKKKHALKKKIIATKINVEIPFLNILDKIN